MTETTVFDNWGDAVQHDRRIRKQMTRAEYARLTGLTPGVIKGAEENRRMKKPTIEGLLPVMGDLLPPALGGTHGVQSTQAEPEIQQPIDPVANITSLGELERVRTWLSHRYEQVMAYADRTAGAQLDLGKINGRPATTPGMAQPDEFRPWASWLDEAERLFNIDAPDYSQHSVPTSEPTLPAESQLPVLMAALEESVREAKESRARQQQPVTQAPALDLSGDWLPVRLDDDDMDELLGNATVVPPLTAVEQMALTQVTDQVEHQMLSDLELQLHASLHGQPALPADGAVVVQGPWQQFDPPQQGRREPERLMLEADKLYATNSVLQTWSDCRRRWWLESYKKLATGARSVTGAAALGTRVHEALAVFYVPEGETPGDPLAELAWTVADDKAYLESTQAPPARFKELEAEHDFAQILIEGYLEWVEETGADRNFSVLSVEKGMVANPGFPGMEHVRLLSKEDTRLRRNQDGAVVFIDHKVVQSFDQLAGWAHLNRQLIHYGLVEFLTAAEQQFQQNGEHGAPTEAHTTDGAMLNMLRKVKRSATAKPPFFHRHTVRFNTETFRSYWRQVFGTMREIIATIEKLDVGGDHHELCPPRPTQDCSWKCQFFAFCSSFDDGSDADRLMSEQFVTVDPIARYNPELRKFIQ